MTNRRLDDVTIRSATVADIPQLLAMIRELAEYERLAHEVLVTAADLERWLFGAEALAHAVLAEHDGAPVGYAVYFRYYNTFRGKPGMYLEDIYVRERCRRHGVGAALFTHVAALAQQHDCTRLEWIVLDWNTHAIEFYQRRGAKPQGEGWTVYALGPEALATAAASTARI